MVALFWNNYKKQYIKSTPYFYKDLEARFSILPQPREKTLFLRAYLIVKNNCLEGSARTKICSLLDELRVLCLMSVFYYFRHELNLKP